MGVSLAMSQRFREAIAQHKEAFEILSSATVSKRGSISDSHPSLCKILINWSWALTRVGEFAEAELRAERALEITEGSDANMDGVKTSVLRQLAMNSAADGRPVDALRSLLETSALADRELGDMR